MEDRRRFPRLSSNFAIEVIPSDSGQGTGQNVSQGGLMFTHPGAISPGTVLYLTLRVPGLSGSVDVKGKVVRCEAVGTRNMHNVAVNFVDMDEESERVITELLESF